MPSQPFEESNIQYAYRSIHTFFNNYLVSDAVSYLESILRAATTLKLWKKEDPAQLLLFIELLQELIAAALEIYYSKSIRETAILKKDNGTGISLQQNFVSNSECNAWNCFPRSLTLQQYYNPYKAIKKFAATMAIQEWKIFIKDCTEYALLKGTIADVQPAYDILLIRLRLLQLIEACHLLHIRINVKIEIPAS